MGQKVNPTSMRLGIINDWNTKWYAKRDYAKLFHEDLALEKAIRKHIETEGLSHIEILRAQGKVMINIHTAKPGLIIGRGGESIEKLKETLKKIFKQTFVINIKEIKKPMLNAAVVADNIARQIERRVSYRRAAKQAIEKIMESGAKGAKILLAGRLNGVEIARSEFFSKGKIPLHTFRADIDYASIPASTTYGQIGLKVWIYKGEVFKKDLDQRMQQQIEEMRNS